MFLFRHRRVQVWRPEADGDGREEPAARHRGHQGREDPPGPHPGGRDLLQPVAQDRQDEGTSVTLRRSPGIMQNGADIFGLNYFFKIYIIYLPFAS